MNAFSGYLPELAMGFSSLLAHKLRSLLTMLGMIFGVGAVVAYIRRKPTDISLEDEAAVVGEAQEMRITEEEASREG